MKYDLSDYNDQIQLKYDFESIPHEEWQSYFDFLNEGDNWKRYNKEAIKIGLYNAGNARKLSPSQMQWALSVSEAVKKAIEIKEKGDELESEIKKEEFNQPLKHFTLRVAWHDSAWNGSVCKDPVANRYCNGYHSLLSERLRIEKEKNLQNEIDNAGKDLTSIDYLPPCYWSININGESKVPVQHYNPAAKELDKISEILEPHSMFSWPFAISFTRTKKQVELEGAYPANLDPVRIPIFREKVKEKRSVAFIYAKYSNPFTEEERQYLVIGAALVQQRGDLHKFGPFQKIAAKRETSKKNKNFPVINWALQFSLDKGSQVMMPYHEYLEKAKSINDSEQREQWLNKIKVAVYEPELAHCFKYVAMDIDDDEAIYTLSKMRQKLVDCKNDGIVAPEEMNHKIQMLDDLSRHCWAQRGYFPGFKKITEILLERDNAFEKFIEEIKLLEPELQSEKILNLIGNPPSDANFKSFKNDLFDLKEALEQHGITAEQLLSLSMLNLTNHQFKRIISGKILDFDTSYHQVARKNITPIQEVCNNPYLLVEDYTPQENLQNEITGEEIDSPIELFKIDIAYFPDARILNNSMPRLDIQRAITVSDKRRLRCVIINHLKSLEDSGDCFEEASELENALKSYPLFYQQGADLTLKVDLFKSKDAARDNFFEETEKKLKIVDGKDTRFYYLNEIYQAEKKIGDKMLELLAQPKNDLRFTNLVTYVDNSIQDRKKKLGEAFNRQDFQTDRLQLYDHLYSERLFILAGGPGSGKSHELLNILQDLKIQGERYLLLTPTGKAALRLKTDPTFKNVEASTIEKWLKEIESGRFAREKISKINNLVIDEMSMVSLLKFLEVINLFQFSNPSFKRLILVGDPNQLPAIGYGKVLKDLVYYLKSHSEFNKNYIELTGNLRFELKRNKVIELSEAFEEKGELTEELETIFSSKIEDQKVSDGFKICTWSNEHDLKSKIESEFDNLCISLGVTGNKQENLHQLLGLGKNGNPFDDKFPTLDNFQILTPYLSGLSGADGLNDYFQKTFKDHLELELMQGCFKESDKIIRTKNYYDYETNELKISNGSIGIIRNAGKEILQFQEDRYSEILLKEIRKNEREFFELAYAISVHKSQGSGFDHLFIIIPDRVGLLSRELVYTALTRCRKSVTLFIQSTDEKPKSKSLLEYARNRTFTDSRKTTLLLDQPFRYFSLEPEKGVFVQSRTELMIYHELKRKREELGNANFDFFYEKYPVGSNGQDIKIKTDFTIISKGHTWYWEHLGRLGNRVYDRTWKMLKRPTYVNNGLEVSLITTDELRGLSTEKIEKIVHLIAEHQVETEDPNNKYSQHHFSLRD